MNIVSNQKSAAMRPIEVDNYVHDQGNQVSETEQDAQEGADDTPPDVLGLVAVFIGK